MFDKYDNIVKNFNENATSKKSTDSLDCLYIEKELSDKLKICRRTLNEYRREGILPYIQLGGKILYKQSDVQKLLQKNYIEAYK